MQRAIGQTHFRRISILVAGIVSAPVLVLWSWNVTVADLFGGPTMAYRNAVGLVVLGLFASVLLGRRGRSRHFGRRHAGEIR